jgi:hypothetical protein
MNQELKDILDVIDKLEARLNRYGAFYQVIVTALIGWFISSEISLSLVEGSLAIVSVGVFLSSNLVYWVSCTKRILAGEKELNALAKKSCFMDNDWKNELSTPQMPNRLLWGIVLYTLVDALVIILIFTRIAWSY